MKYFTPELLSRYGSENPSIQKAAEAEWEERCERYNAYLDSVKEEMPAGLRLIEDNYYLHDAVVRGMGRRGQAFVVMLQLDAPPHSLLTFTYDLVEEPVIRQGVMAPEHCTPNTHVEWQYDELQRIPGNPPTWSQSILLSNGWEAQLHFRAVEVQEAQAVLPVPHDVSGLGSVLPIPQSA